MSSFSKNNRSIILIVLAISWLGLSLLVGKPQTPPKKRIILEHADQLTYDKDFKPDFKRLIGNVSLSHGKASMQCDSAYLNESTNSFNGYGNIHMSEDTIDIYSDSLYYDGIARIARLRDHVRLENGKAVLYTDSLDYDRNTSTGYYFEGGTITDPENTLTSDYGEYNTITDEAYFTGNVVLENKNFTLTTQELRYNTTTHIATILGQTLIESDSGYIETTRGTYDTEKNVGILLDNSTVHSKNAVLNGDSIYYDGAKKFGEVFGNMSIDDSVKKVMLFGQYGYYDEERQYAFATLRSFAVDYSRKDTLYVGADSLELITYKDLPKSNPLRPIRKMTYSVTSNLTTSSDSTLQEKKTLPSDTTVSGNDSLISKLDSIGKDTAVDSIVKDSVDCHIIRAYHHMRLYSNDAQAVSDSMEYMSVDSVLFLCKDVSLWQDKDQLSADTVKSFFKSDSLYAVTASSNVIGMEQIDTAMYNQISCSLLNVFFQDSVVNYVEAFEDVNSIYYLAKEKTQDYYAMNRMKSNEMYLFLDNDSIQKAIWIPAEGKIYPTLKTDPSIRKLDAFKWLDNIRPKSPEDIFTDNDSTQTDSVAQKSMITLSDLRRFSGAQAALRAYDALNKHMSKDKESKNIDKSGMKSDVFVNDRSITEHRNSRLSNYIRRDNVEPYTEPTYNYLKWVYSNPTIIQENQESLTIL
ncbi:OstA-like protein [Falsiporphyromonas endometrii]|uniref:OstA-like protein n=1 Tax=Falsiporphyromonas endometrii TaxID=1387297 RepID=A0ABV9K860_9PORP